MNTTFSAIFEITPEIVKVWEAIVQHNEYAKELYKLNSLQLSFLKGRTNPKITLKDIKKKYPQFYNRHYTYLCLFTLDTNLFEVMARSSFKNIIENTGSYNGDIYGSGEAAQAYLKFFYDTGATWVLSAQTNANYKRSTIKNHFELNDDTVEIFPISEGLMIPGKRIYGGLTSDQAMKLLLSNTVKKVPDDIDKKSIDVMIYIEEAEWT